MANTKEMALGIVTDLGTGHAPNPLPIELWGYASEDAADLLRYIIDECHDAYIFIREIRADPVIVHEIARSRTEVGVSHRGVQITADPAQHGRLEVHSR
jgi:hypothetical protein